MYKLLKPFLFLLKPEQAHYFTVGVLQLLHKFRLLPLFFSKAKGKPIEKMGLTFPNKLGLAAGFDKNGEWINEMAQLGFGFIEVGTVTPKPQPGNEKPRLFRLPKHQALINRMGFNNKGVDYLVEQLKQVKNKDIIIGGNIGKNKNTPNDQAVSDYVFCFEKLFDFVDYFAVNVSSPNTPNLRQLQAKEHLIELLQTLQNINHSKENPKPILLKVSPDLTYEAVREVAEIVQKTNIAGVIATNTTISRKQIDGKHSQEAGGLSGKPLQHRANQKIALFRQFLGDKPVIIGVGGIDSKDEAQAKLDVGADLIQIYTGMVYKGPQLIRKIVKLC